MNLGDEFIILNLNFYSLRSYKSSVCCNDCNLRREKCFLLYSASPCHHHIILNEDKMSFITTRKRKRRKMENKRKIYNRMSHSFERENISLSFLKGDTQHHKNKFRTIGAIAEQCLMRLISLRL